MLILRRAFEFQKYHITLRDDRLDSYLFMGSSTTILAIIGFYLYFVLNLGPKLMKNRQPFNLKTVMNVYNILQVILNLLLTVTYWVFKKQYNILCVPMDYSPNGLIDAELTYCYFLLKLLDLMDTIFMILRKNFKQVSFLHVYHHIGILLGSYIGAQYIPGGHAFLLGLINCFVHVVMYFYYFLTSWNPNLKKSIWWKKYITQIQLLQFFLLIVHFAHPLIITECAYPKFWLWVALLQNLFMLILFGDFYRKAYVRKNKDKF